MDTGLSLLLITDIVSQSSLYGAQTLCRTLKSIVRILCNENDFNLDLQMTFVRFSGSISGDGVRCILGAAKIVYCFGQVTSVTDDLSMGLMSVPI